MSTAVAVVNIVLAVVSVAATVAGAVISRRRLDNAAPEPDLSKHPTADEGNAAAWIFGPYNRVSGQVIYLSKIEAVRVAGSEKGKSDQAVIFNYQATVGIAWCRNECEAQAPVSRIWASGELIFDKSRLFNIVLPDVDIYMDQRWDILPGPHEEVSGGNIYCSPTGRARNRITNRKMILRFNVFENSQTDIDLLALQSQASTLPITISGTNNPINSGTFTISSFWNDRDNPFIPGQIQWDVYIVRCVYIYPSPIAATAEENCTPSNPSCVSAVTEFNTPLTFEVTVTGFSLYYPTNGITHYPGSNLQEVDPVIAADPGIPIGTLPAFRGTCYTVIRDLDITKWASTLPHFEAEVRTVATPPFIKSAFDAVLARNEATTAYKTDTTLLSTVLTPIFGLQERGPTPPGNTLNTLMQVYDVEAQERLVQSGFDRVPENVLFFVARDDIPVQVLDYDLTSARETSEAGRVHALVKRSTKDNLPNEFILDYIEFERNLQPGTTSFTVSTGGVRNTQKLTVPYTLSQPLADKLCREMIWKALRFHDKIEFNLPPKQYGITEGDRLQLNTPSDGLPIQARVEQITVGENGLLEVSCEIDDDLAYNQLEGGGYSADDPTTVVIPNIGEIIVMDIAPLASTETQRFGLYVVNEVLEVLGSTNYVVFTSLDQINWTQAIILQGIGVAGSALTLLAPPDDVHSQDFANTVTIRLNSTVALESVPLGDLEAGMNWAFLGGEIIGFQTATLVGGANPREYVLSGLLRGRNNSEQFMAAHNIFETFVLLPPSSNAVAFIELEPSLYQTTIFVALAPAGIPVEDALQIAVTPSAETLRPYSVDGLWGIKRPNGDTCVFATTRTRVPFRILSALVPPFVETGPASDYFADIYWLVTVTTWEFLRTVTACEAPNGQIAFEYTADQQVIDLVNTGKIAQPDPGLNFRFIIARTSDSIGPGREVEFCIQSIGAEFEGSCLLA